MILYEGPSALDGAPIAVILTGANSARASRNAKTGDMLQTWIMRADIAPHHAVKSGADSSVCGACPHRPALAGSCYVKTFQAPRSVWEAYRRGVYSHATPQAIRDACEGRAVRFGAYGDPAAAPIGVWSELARWAATWTGYTHQWRTAPLALARYLMASADSEAEGVLARASGWRTFRVREASEPIGPREFVCPASEGAGKRTDCASCRACGGTGAKAKASPVIVAHGGTARRFALTRQGVAA